MKYRWKTMMCTSKMKFCEALVKRFTWWLCVLGGVILQSWWRGNWGKYRCPGGTEVSIQGPRLSPWPGVGRQWTGEIAGALTRHAPWAGGAAGSPRCFFFCWSGRRGELQQSMAGGQKAGAEESITAPFMWWTVNMALPKSYVGDILI